MVMKQSLLSLIIAFVTLLAGCSGSKTDQAVTTIDDNAKIPGSPLYVQVTSSYEGTSDMVYQGGCYFDSTDAAPMAKTCTIRIPELVLHYSDLHFKIGTSDLTHCSQVSFRPYYYIRSTSATYKAPGSSAITDCSNLNSVLCFGGAGPTMLPSFLKARGVYFLPYITDNQTYVLPSSNSYLINKDGDSSYSENINTCNNLSDRTTPITDPTSAYVGGGYYFDYLVQCSDDWAEVQYQFTLTIADYDTDGGASGTYDNYYDWGD